MIIGLGMRAAMLRAFMIRFDSSVHMMRLMLLRAVTMDPSRCQRQGVDCMWTDCDVSSSVTGGEVAWRYLAGGSTQEDGRLPYFSLFEPCTIEVRIV